MKSHSQFGEDAWIVLHAPFDLQHGTFCEVGAFDGIQSSNTLLFEELFGWQGLCLEPDPLSFFRCVDNRKCPCLALSASNELGPVTYYLNEEDRGQSGLKAKGKPIRGVAVRLDSILRIFDLQDLTLLSIDTEGTELDVWEGLGELRPNIVIIEYLSGDGVDRSKEIVARLTADGYQQVHRTEANLIFTRA